MAAGSTYTPIATNTLSSATGTVTFSSISGSYTDLILIGNGSMSAAGSTVYVRLNSDTGSNYSATILDGNGTSAVSGRATAAANGGSGFPIGDWYRGYSTGRFMFSLNLMNYANTTTYKTGISQWSQADNSVEAIVSLWASISAISSLTIRSNSGSDLFNAGSTFTLYGILAA